MWTFEKSVNPTHIGVSIVVIYRNCLRNIDYIYWIYLNAIQFQNTVLFYYINRKNLNWLNTWNFLKVLPQYYRHTCNSSTQHAVSLRSLKSYGISNNLNTLSNRPNNVSHTANFRTHPYIVVRRNNADNTRWLATIAIHSLIRGECT